MKIMFEDKDNYLTVCEVASIDNGVTSIFLDGPSDFFEKIKVENVVRFTLKDGETIYIVVDKNAGNDIVTNAYRYDKFDLTGYKDMTIFYPEVEDMEEIKSIVKSVFK